ncbi:hypothetical protein H0H92_008160, partial [Tricholoma furcatifolium]
MPAELSSERRNQTPLKKSEGNGKIWKDSPYARDVPAVAQRTQRVYSKRAFKGLERMRACTAIRRAGSNERAGAIPPSQRSKGRATMGGTPPNSDQGGGVPTIKRARNDGRDSAQQRSRWRLVLIKRARNDERDSAQQRSRRRRTDDQKGAQRWAGLRPTAIKMAAYSEREGASTSKLYYQYIVLRRGDGGGGGKANFRGRPKHVTEFSGMFKNILEHSSGLRKFSKAEDLIDVESVAQPRELLLSETLEHEPVSVGVLGGGQDEDEGALRRTIEGVAPPHARLEGELEQEEEGEDSSEEDDGPGQVEGRADGVGEEDDEDSEDDESSEEGVAQDDEDWGPEDMMPEPVDPEDWRRAWERR